MSPAADPPPACVTPPPCALIRRELGQHFGQYPALVDGLLLRSWRGGPLRGEAKIPAAARGLIDRGLVEVRPARLGHRAVFTPAGLRALRRWLEGSAVDPGLRAHLLRELRMEPAAVDAE